MLNLAGAVEKQRRQTGRRVRWAGAMQAPPAVPKTPFYQNRAGSVYEVRRDLASPSTEPLRGRKASEEPACATAFQYFEFADGNSRRSPLGSAVGGESDQPATGKGTIFGTQVHPRVDQLGDGNLQPVVIYDTLPNGRSSLGTTIVRGGSITVTCKIVANPRSCLLTFPVRL